MHEGGFRYWALGHWVTSQGKYVLLRPGKKYQAALTTISRFNYKKNHSIQQALHICFQCDHYPGPGVRAGGIGIFVQTLGRMLVKQGFSVTAFGAGYRKDAIENDEGVQVIRLAKSRWRFGKFIQNVWRTNAVLKKLHKENAISIIECSEVGLGFIRKLKGVKHVIRMNGGHHFFKQEEHLKLVPATAWLEKKSFEKADAICAVSQYVNKETAILLGFDALKTVIINNGVFQKRLEESAGNIEVSEGRIVFAGTVCEKKGVRQLIQSFATVKAVVPNATLFILGAEWLFPDGKSYIQYLQQYISEDIKPFIQFVGPVANTDIPKWLASAQVCAYPSHSEALPMAWLEAMALGKPVVASKTGPGPEVIEHEKEGLLCDPYDPQSIAENIIRMLTDGLFAQECGKHAKQKVKEQFDMQNLVHQNIAFYRKVAGGEM